MTSRDRKPHFAFRLISTRSLLGAAVVGAVIAACSILPGKREHAQVGDVAQSASPDAAPRIESRPPTTPLPAPPEWAQSVASMYEQQLKVPGLESRIFQPEAWWRIATPLLRRDRGFINSPLGSSAEGRPLRHVSWGQGPTRVLLWSQMHGDESTATMALADLFRFLGEHPDHPVARRLRSNTTLHFLPLMNPDGAARFQRRNAQGIDLNQDADALATPEARALKSLYDEVKPQFGFNLHDQRPGYRAGQTDQPVAIALLSPPFDASRDVNAVRRRAMEVGVAVRSMLEPQLAGRFGRWDDTFNPRAFGDLTTRWGTSTLLIEAGGIEGDPEKQQLRRHYFMALLAALDAIATGSHAGADIGHYFAIPQNGAVWPDLLLRGGTIVSPGIAPLRADVLVNFKEPLAERGGVISNVGDLSRIKVRETIDISDLYLQPLPCPTSESPSTEVRPLVPETPACFQLSRDAEGRDVVWKLLRDVNQKSPRPRR